MKNKWRILKILVTVAILGFLLSFSLKRFSQKPLETVAVNLKQSPVYFIDEKDIRNLVKKQNPAGKVGTVDIPTLEKNITNLPAVDSANVYMNLNGTLNIDIKQRVPAFRLNRNGQDLYVDGKGVESPISKNYSHPCMLVTGNVTRDEYPKLIELIKKINEDDFSKKYFIGISKSNGNYNLLTSDANYKVEIGDLDRIDFKVKGFKAFVEKYLVYQDPEKYSKISVKYDNQIVTTLNPNFKANDSILSTRAKSIAKLPQPSQPKTVVKEKPKAAIPKKVVKKEVKKTIPKPKPVTAKKPAPKKTQKPAEKGKKKINKNK